ncbi:phosphoserine phosphatase SerB [Candidatus Nitrosoglobus terrae]|uniref:Phosphoserine phosphatase n=1 Tax=Candidatus Nitrosoglobus terrae TaxID=1630141 RepID=A0A1Q2SP65_9GAMM|nr:phosphoserine phosphatase SerB [Candidatus Nitrosoglobus terrae]BAW80893.1 phosphoserine phosphatase SerB [Candidatus Nitrosoglobus terrae]
MPILVLQGPGLTLDIAHQIAQQTNSHFDSKEPQFYGYRLHNEQPLSSKTLAILSSTYKDIDINFLPQDYDPDQVQLFVTDMDSTLINIECIDEIAAYINQKARVSAITAAAMRGETSFESSLIQRVKLLANTPVSILTEVYDKRLLINPGGKDLLAALKQRGIKIALVSGGFTYFTERLQLKYSIDYTLANQLEIKDGHLTGNIISKIVDATAKAKFLLRLCQNLNIKPSQVIAIGDGANDLEMLAAAGLSIAYRAKPRVRSQAQITLDYSGLEGVLAFLPAS